jgi:hypothetical protein
MNNGLLGFPLGQMPTRIARTGFRPRWPMLSPALLAASGRAQIAASASANTKGNWGLLLGPISFDATWLCIQFDDNQTNREWLSDIGIDRTGNTTAPTETIADNLHHFARVSGSAIEQGGTPYAWDVLIPVGSTIFIRTQSSSGSAVTFCSAYAAALANPHPGPLVPLHAYQAGPRGVLTSYGPDTSDSGLTNVDPGGSANVKGAWSQLTGEITWDARYIYLKAGNKNNTARTTCDWNVDIGLGPVGQERVLVPDILFQDEGAPMGPLPDAWHFPLLLPAGERLAVRAACTITDATDRLIDLALYAVS